MNRQCSLVFSDYTPTSLDALARAELLATHDPQSVFQQQAVKPVPRPQYSRRSAISTAHPPSTVGPEAVRLIPSSSFYSSRTASRPRRPHSRRRPWDHLHSPSPSPRSRAAERPSIDCNDFLAWALERPGTAVELCATRSAPSAGTLERSVSSSRRSGCPRRTPQSAPGSAVRCGVTRISFSILWAPSQTELR